MKRAAAWASHAARAAGRSVVGLLLPDVCGGCGRQLATAEGLCDDCSRDLLTLVGTSYCPRCGTTIGPNIPVRAEGCNACPVPMPRFETVVRLGPYADPLRTAILDAKFHRQEAMVRRLGALLSAALLARHEGSDYDLAMPVPMHWRRRFSRGCNLAAALARVVGRELEVPVGDELVRIRHTPQQAHLPRTSRFENIRGAFAVQRPAVLARAHVILVDDVTTTGATANEAARTLLDAGASRVTLAVLCKAEAARAYSATMTK